MKYLDLTDEEAAALTQELHEIVESDPYLFASRIRTVRAILAKLTAEQAREPLPRRSITSRRAQSEVRRRRG
jgi:hypothetical protein